MNIWRKNTGPRAFLAKLCGPKPVKFNGLSA